MIVYKTFLKVLNKCKVPIIIYTVILLVFAFANTMNDEGTSTFTASTPDIYIKNGDRGGALAESLEDYLKEGCKIIELSEEEVEDALFYRHVNLALYIPVHYSEFFMNGEAIELKFKGTGDYMSSLAEMMIKRFLSVANTYRSLGFSEEQIVEKTRDTLSENVEIEVASNLDGTLMDKLLSYYNFTNYCLLAGSIFIITLMMNIMKSEKIANRIAISGTSMRTFNRHLLLANSVFSIALWLLYFLISILVIGRPALSVHGLLMAGNMFVFSMFALTLAFALGNLVKNKEAINGIVNVIALGSSFLCGSFVPLEMLPESVVKVAHILPSYWFIKTNGLISEVENFTSSSMSEIFANMGIVIGFSFLCILLTNIVLRMKRKIV